MQVYLQRFHDTKDVFVRYRASKASKAKADSISKELTVENRKWSAKEIRRTATEKACTLALDKEQRASRVNEALVEDSHFNFPKIHLMMH